MRSKETFLPSDWQETISRAAELLRRKSVEVFETLPTSSDDIARHAGAMVFLGRDEAVLSLAHVKLPIFMRRGVPLRVVAHVSCHDAGKRLSSRIPDPDSKRRLESGVRFAKTAEQVRDEIARFVRETLGGSHPDILEAFPDPDAR